MPPLLLLRVRGNRFGTVEVMTVCLCPCANTRRAGRKRQRLPARNASASPQKRQRLPARNVRASPPEMPAPPRPRESSQHQPHTKPCGIPSCGHQRKDSGHPAATQKSTKITRQKPTKNILIFFKKPIDKQNPLVYNNQARKQWLVGQAVKTLASHAENMGSIPVRVTKENRTPIGVLFSFFWCLVRHRTHSHE